LLFVMDVPKQMEDLRGTPLYDTLRALARGEANGEMAPLA
jgi:hypothetical protein